MKALTITRSPSVMRPSTTPLVARHSITIKPVAMISCCPVLRIDSVVCDFSAARRNRSRLSS